MTFWSIATTMLLQVTYYADFTSAVLSFASLKGEKFYILLILLAALFRMCVLKHTVPDINCA